MMQWMRMGYGTGREGGGGEGLLVFLAQKTIELINYTLTAWQCHQIPGLVGNFPLYTIDPRFQRLKDLCIIARGIYHSGLSVHN